MKILIIAIFLAIIATSPAIADDQTFTAVSGKDLVAWEQTSWTPTGGVPDGSEQQKFCLVMHNHDYSMAKVMTNEDTCDEQFVRAHYSEMFKIRKK